MAALTLHQGDAQQEFAEHPVEVARRALYAAAELEGGDWASLMRRVASCLPARQAVVPSSEQTPDAASPEGDVLTQSAQTAREAPERNPYRKEWDEYYRRQGTWRRMTWEEREAIVLEVLGDESLTVGELATRINAKFGWPTVHRREPWPSNPLHYPPLESGDVRPVAMRLFGRGEFDRVHGPYRHMAAVWHFFRKPGGQEAVA